MPLLGYKWSSERKEKMSKRAKELGFGKWMIGRHLSSETLMKLRGKKLSIEHKRKIGDSHRGNKCYNWKGNKAGYGALHLWIKRTYGNPSKCSSCGKTNKKKYEWCSIGHVYLRDIKTWKRLCTECHRKLDKLMKTK